MKITPLNSDKWDSCFLAAIFLIPNTTNVTMPILATDAWIAILD